MVKLRAKNSKYPSKKTVNLVFHEKTMNSPSRAIPGFLVFAAALGVFVKIGVIGQLNKASEANARLSEVQAQLDKYVEYNVDYEDVKDRYNKYSDDYLDEKERGIVDRVKLLDILRETTMSRATVTNFSVSDMTCQIAITNVHLNVVSDIVNELEKSPYVYFIAVSTAATDRADQNAENAENTSQLVTANLTVTLLDSLSAAEKEKAQGEQPAAQAEGGQTS